MFIFQYRDLNCYFHIDIIWISLIIYYWCNCLVVLVNLKWYFGKTQSSLTVDYDKR